MFEFGISGRGKPDLIVAVLRGHADGSRKQIEIEPSPR